MSKLKAALVVALLVVAFFRSLDAEAAEPGECVVANNLGLPLYTHNFDSGKTTTIDDKVLLSQFIGAHCFLTEHLRLGMMFQWTEQW
jgi:hypothetical protein